MIRPALIAVLVASTCASASAAATVSLPLERDAVLMEAHAFNNDGSWAEGWVKTGLGLRNRWVGGVDLTPLEGRASAVQSAHLRLYISKGNFLPRPTAFDIHAFDPSSSLGWTEGDDRWDIDAYCTIRALARTSKIFGGRGATWSCADDPDTADESNAGCASAWTGGFPGFSPVPAATVTGTSALNRVCSKSLKCYAAGGSVDACWAAIEFDVTASVVAALASGNLRPSWLIKRQIEDKTGGGFRFFSREGAACILGIPALRPHLRVALNEAPPIIADVPDHCQFSAR
jgi:hypothetical protein